MSHDPGCASESLDACDCRGTPAPAHWGRVHATKRGTTMAERAAERAAIAAHAEPVRLAAAERHRVYMAKRRAA